MGSNAVKRRKPGETGEVKKPSGLLDGFGFHIEVLPAESLKPYPENPRKHPERSIQGIAASIEAFGFKNVVLVDKNHELIFGHGRVEAAKRLGLKTIPVLVDEDLTKDQARALRIADNATQSLSEWNQLNLKQEILSLRAAGLNLKPLGFSIVEIDDFLGFEKDEDPGPQVLSKDVVTKKGDLWHLGDHRLYCADSTNPKDIARLMDGKKAKLFSTDPPYIVSYSGKRPGKKGGKKDSGKDWSSVYHEIDTEKGEDFFRTVFKNALEILEDDAPWYCWHAHKWQGKISQIWNELGILDHQEIVWVKPSATMSTVIYPQKHEPCLFGWKKGHKPNIAEYGDFSHNHTTVWEFGWDGKGKVTGNEHPTQKPVEIFEIPIMRHTYPDDIVYEPFCGSGSQLIAAEKRHRKCYAMEIQPAFVDSIIRRWEKMTGNRAVLSKV